MPIYQSGALNVSALNAPGVYLQIQPPPPIINGVATNLLGLVGVGSWGPVNSATLIGSGNDQANWLGSPQVRKYDLSTAVQVALAAGSNAIMYVRVTDGTDIAASCLVKDTAGTVTGLTLTALYTGTIGNTLTAAITTGTAPSSFKLTLTRPGFTPEVFDNVTGTGAALWTAFASAVNNGLSGVRGPSQLFVATVGSSTAAPGTSATFTATGGTDGTASITDAALLGTDGTSTTRKGMYALRSSGVQVATLVDHTDSTAWGSIASFALNEGIYFGVQGPAGASYSTVSTSLNTAGADTYALKVFVGDWIYWQDGTNNVQRLLGPTTFWAPKQAAMAPHLSSLNDAMFGIASTQRVSQKNAYSMAEIGQVATSRLDVITNNSPGGNYFACQTGRNASSNAAICGDNYTRMTNYLALTLAAAFGYVIGKPQTDTLRNEAKSAIQSFLGNLWNIGYIGDVNNPQAVPYTVVLDSTNNTDQAVANGYMTANVAVKYLSIVFYFVINLQGGQTVTIKSSSSVSAG
jgi:phage tail sheath protein FI